MFFEQKVDLRSREAMVTFLKGHFRYNTMNSWNGSTSYAQCVKLHRLGLSPAQYDRAFEMLDLTEVSDMVQSGIADFTEAHNGCYTMGTNGRSGGYLVLYSSRYEETGHKSRCRSCGQLNFKRVYEGKREGAEGVIASELIRSGCAWVTPTYLGQAAIQALGLAAEEICKMVDALRPACKDASWDSRCGRCHADGERGRFNLSAPRRELKVWPGRSIDDDVEWEELSMSSLKDKVHLVQSFDAACDRIRDGFIELLEDYQVIESVVMVPRTVRSLELRTN